MATPSPNKKGLHAFTTLFFFFFLFVFSIFIFTKQSLSPSLSLYRLDLYSSDPELPPLLSIPEPTSSISQFQPPDARLSSQKDTNGELNVEENRNPEIESENGRDPAPDTEKDTISVSDAENERDPISGNEAATEDEREPAPDTENERDPVADDAADNERHPISGNGPGNETGDNGSSVDESVRKCDLYAGSWVQDEKSPLYEPGSCPYVDEAFDCQPNGRPDAGYMKWRWKPNGCDLPRFNATDFLMRLRGKRLMLVGDSMNRNQYESLLCMLREGLHNKSRMYETHGYKISKGRGYFVFKFEDFDCTVEFVRSHFLVKEGVRMNAQGSSNPTLSIDRIDKTNGRWKRADILVFNTGHWWTHGKTARGKNYYKEGDYIYPKFDAVEAYRRALKTWAQWIDQNMDPKRKLVMYRGYSSAHFRGGDWDSGGNCNGEKEPVLSGAILNSYPLKMRIVEEVIQEMKFPVILLNVTSLTNFRKDGHPSVYGKNTSAGKKVSTRRQDCSHWCLPGVPDAWNELIYVSLLLQKTTD